MSWGEGGFMKIEDLEGTLFIVVFQKEPDLIKLRVV